MVENKAKKHTKNSFILIILLLAAVRVFVFNAVFPIGNNVDEHSHIDMVCKYARGHIPKHGVEHYDRLTSELFIIYASPEYWTEDTENFPLLWKIPDVKKTKRFQDTLVSAFEEINYETGSFPLYYLWGGFWWNIGNALHLSDVSQLYLLRFLNIPVFIAMVWLAYLTAKNLFPDNDFLQKGLAIMTAFFPQDAFYAVTNDAISPLLALLSFFMLMKILFEDKSLYFYFLSAVVIAATLLNKITNITVLALLAMTVILKLHQVIEQKKLRKHLLRLFILIGVSIVPLCLWLIRNRILFGDITATADKGIFLEWELKPFNQIIQHPIFTFGGIMEFLAELTRTFWRGEFAWHRLAIASKLFDSLYIISTGIFLLVSFIFFLKSKNTKKRTVWGISFVLIFVSVLMLAVLSPLYDYGRCAHPSKEHPYFTSGRLILTILVPFLILYLAGLKKLWDIFKIRFNPLILVAFWAVAITVSELLLTGKVFASPYNWFHLIL